MPESVWTQFKTAATTCSFWQEANQKWSKHRFYRYIICHASERHGGATGSKTWTETLQKGELWHKMENDCSWLAKGKVIVL